VLLLSTGDPARGSGRMGAAPFARHKTAAIRPEGVSPILTQNRFYLCDLPFWRFPNPEPNVILTLAIRHAHLQPNHTATAATAKALPSWSEIAVIHPAAYRNGAAATH
jgi:hypothetical protein